MASINIESRYTGNIDLIKKKSYPLRCGACNNTKKNFFVKVYGMIDEKKRTCIDFEAMCKECGYKRIPIADLELKPSGEMK